MNPWVTQLPRISGVWQEPFDLPDSLARFAARFSHRPGTVVLLSGSDLDCARYHILGISPWFWIRAKGCRIDIFCRNTKIHLKEDPFACLQALLGHFHLTDGNQHALPLAAGLMGYLAYDLKDVIEALPQTCVDTGLPDLFLAAPSLILVQDRVSNSTTLSVPLLDDLSVPPEVYVRQLKQMLEDETGRMDRTGDFSMAAGGLVSGFEKSQYLEAVEKIIRYLRAGDIYQANLAQRFETGFSGDPYALFQALFHRNPAPFFAFVQAGDHQIVSTSPERFLLQQGTRVETRPIKGTIARGATPEQDQKNGQTLCRSIKDAAELTMIVDLMRNDLSRVTVHDSVTVTEHKRLEPYENVFHLVSIVQGDLLSGKTAADLLKAAFPGGSITGCPKIRAMEIIDELEPVKRHVYTGSIGYISFHDTMDLSIAIRTATITDRRIFFSVGGGIVYDSDPEKEFQETLDKGKTIMETLAKGKITQLEPVFRAWVNGKILDQNQAVVPAGIPGFQYGAGVFETIRVKNGKPVRLFSHIHRMNRSWQTLFGIDPPAITWDRVVDLLVRENRLETATAALKIIMATPLFLGAFVRPYLHRLDSLGKTGLDLVTYPYPRETPLAGHKTLNYLYYDLAGRYAKENHGDEALILNPDHTVSETNTCNILIIQGKKAIVPASPHVLPGVTVGAAVSWLKQQGYLIENQPVRSESLVLFPNILLTNALMGAVRVNHVDGRPVCHDPGVCEMINSGLET